MTAVLQETNFTFPGQVDEVYHGKVGDVYTIGQPDEENDLLVVVRTDRVSAFDVLFPEPIPHKGQVLNQMGATLLSAASSVAPNWLLGAPDPNASIGIKAEPIPIEMIMRGSLLGNSWRAYRDGERNYCGNRLPDGLHEFEVFDRPLLTPNTKATVGHDEPITPSEIVDSGLVTAREYAQMAEISFALFAHGQQRAREQGLFLADTKYELGRLASGELVVIDEVHTPDSSRYFRIPEYEGFLKGTTDQRPQQLSKEFVREWLLDRGFDGTAGQEVPALPDDFRSEVGARYIDLYQQMLGLPFLPAQEQTVEVLQARIESNILHYLQNELR